MRWFSLKKCLIGIVVFSLLFISAILSFLTWAPAGIARRARTRSVAPARAIIGRSS